MRASATTRDRRQVQRKAQQKECSCPECDSGGRPIPVHEFGKNSSSPDGLHWYCRNCNNRKQREWKRANSKKVAQWKADYDERNRKRNGSGQQGAA